MTLTAGAGWILSDKCLFLSPEKGSEDCAFSLRARALSVKRPIIRKREKIGTEQMSLNL